MTYSFVLCQYELLAVTSIVVAKFFLELVWPLVACIVHNKNGKVESALLDWSTADALEEPLQPAFSAICDAIEDSAEDLGLEHYWLVVYLFLLKDVYTRAQ